MRHTFSLQTENLWNLQLRIMPKIKTRTSITDPTGYSLYIQLDASTDGYISFYNFKTKTIEDCYTTASSEIRTTSLKATPGATDVLLIEDNTVGWVKKRVTIDTLSTASNGLTKTNLDIALGGTLTGNTAIDTDGSDFEISSSSGGDYLINTGSAGNDSSLALSVGTATLSSTISSIVNSIQLASAITVTDGVNSKGIVNAADYSANSTARSLIDKAEIQALIAASGGTFVNLTDTPANYTSAAGKILKVNSTPDAVEFSTLLIDASDNLVSGTYELIVLRESENSVYLATGSDHGSAGGSADYNVAVGSGAMPLVSSGNNAIAIGASALAAFTTGNYNIGIGRSVGAGITSGDKHILIGGNAGLSLTTTDEGVMIGHAAGILCTGSRNVFLGPRAGNKQVAVDDYLIIDNQTRADAATGLTDSLIVGKFDASTANQWIRINGALAVNGSVLTNQTAGDVLAEGGSMITKEITTPTADTNYGKWFTKTDNKPYFQDGAGSEHEIATAQENYGEMYFYESSGTETIGVTNQYYGINGEFGAGDLSNFTFNAGSNGSGNITTSGGGAAININNVAHGLVSGDYVAVQSANHTGREEVTKVDNDNFTVPIAYVGDEAGTWQQGDYLLAGTGSAGDYRITLSITGSAGAAAKNYKFEIVQNDTDEDKAAFEITTSGTNHQSSSGTCFITVAEGDRLWAIFKNETDTQDLNYEHANLNLNRQ